MTGTSQKRHLHYQQSPIMLIVNTLIVMTQQRKGSAKLAHSTEISRAVTLDGLRMRSSRISSAGSSPVLLVLNVTKHVTTSNGGSGDENGSHIYLSCLHLTIIYLFTHNGKR